MGNNCSSKLVIATVMLSPLATGADVFYRSLYCVEYVQTYR